MGAMTIPRAGRPIASFSAKTPAEWSPSAFAQNMAVLAQADAGLGIQVDRRSVLTSWFSGIM
jgi:hypothetical protein